ncbi:hypothetical protein 043JT007_208 [Bacillus phage 043JT007]|nr:hypothetical protein 043JT007_208 [Bacillus phage 043JT007]
MRWVLRHLKAEVSIARLTRYNLIVDDFPVKRCSRLILG